MKKKLLLPILLFPFIAFSQLGIGTVLPNTSSQLDVVATDKGILIPRVSLKGTTDNSTITNGNLNSLLVFNTAISTDIVPGYYYWFNNKWNKLKAPETGNGAPSSIGSLGDIYVELNTGKVYVYNGTVWIANISQNETLTSLSLDPLSGILTYTDEKGTANTLNLAAVIPNFETVTGISQNLTAGTITYVDEKGISTVLNLKTLIAAYS
ncbi:hypothetical protein D0817_00905 [Flavobacterium cupreum]|uniref:Uncharacterized protein n=1 Tax=Flavobacterium cupreum TaxID=2133766 RepID=A0A434ACV8_9FLAO|nr:hypothetical protein [Flavobacterium cupreum]RUT72210.1 hypothetical protein D0817_00905 [Flavobacterium cupreum]